GWPADPPSSTPSYGHLENVQPTDVPVHRVDDAEVVHVDVVELRGASGPHPGRTRNEARALPRLIGVADVVGAHALVEEGADDRLVRFPRRRHREVLV